MLKVWKILSVIFLMFFIIFWMLYKQKFSVGTDKAPPLVEIGLRLEMSCDSILRLGGGTLANLRCENKSYGSQ